MLFNTFRGINERTYDHTIMPVFYPYIKEKNHLNNADVIWYLSTIFQELFMINKKSLDSQIRL